MKNRVLVFLIVLALSLVTVGVVAAGDGTDLRAVTTGPATLYAEPSADAEVVAELGAHSMLTLVATDESGAWLEVETAEGSGYVMLEDALVLNLPLLAPKVYVSTAQAGATGLYAEPAFSAEYLTQLPDGTVGTVLAADGEWAYVMTSEGTGWSVATAWAEMPETAYKAIVSLGSAPDLGVFDEASIAANVVTTVPNGDVIWVLSEATGQWAEVMTMDGTMGYALMSNLEPLATTMIDALAGSNAYPALYAEPDFGAEILVELADGEAVTYLGEVDNFWVELYHPAYGTAYGLADNFGPVYTTATVAQADALVRQGPNDNIYKVIAQLPAGTEVIVKGLSESGAWVEVAIPFSEVDYAYNGVNGWMRDFLFMDSQGEASFDMELLDVTE